MRVLGFIFDVTAIVAAVAVKFWLPSPGWVDQHYSTGLYPKLDVAVRGLTERIPFTLGDVLLVTAASLLLLWWARALRAVPRGGRFACGARLGLRTVALVGTVFMTFVAGWGFNYLRTPLADKIPVHNERTNEDSVTAYANRVAAQLEANAPGAHAEHLENVEIARRLEPTFEATIVRVGAAGPVTAPPVKPSIAEGFMRASGTNGFMDPWTHEVNLDSEMFAFERPSAIAHEWAHVAGFADESEANLIAVLACINARDPLLRYSGWLLTWFNLPSSVHVTHPLGKLALADIAAIIRRYHLHVKPAVARAQRSVYDSYLKANHVKAGYDSYALFVRWLTGADFDRSGLPVLRHAP